MAENISEAETLAALSEAGLIESESDIAIDPDNASGTAGDAAQDASGGTDVSDDASESGGLLDFLQDAVPGVIGALAVGKLTGNSKSTGNAVVDTVTTVAQSAESLVSDSSSSKSGDDLISTVGGTVDAGMSAVAAPVKTAVMDWMEGFAGSGSSDGVLASFQSAFQETFQKCNQKSTRLLPDLPNAAKSVADFIPGLGG